MNPTGEQYSISYGDHHVAVTEIGATLRSYTVAERDVIVSFAADAVPSGAHGAVLLPWPNRLQDGSYTFNDVDYQLKINETQRNNAIHGLVRELPWRVESHHNAEIVLVCDLGSQPGYPFRLHCQICYQLADDGLSVELIAENQDSKPLPYGVGFHPWLSPGQYSLDECRLKIDADTWVKTNQRLLPIGEEEIPSALDFRQLRLIDGTVLDDAFVGLPSKQATVSLTDPDGGSIVCWVEAGIECWQICTGDGLTEGQARTGIAVEPMSCTANAFRSSNRLITLQPGQTHRVSWGLQLMERYDD